MLLFAELSAGGTLIEPVNNEEVKDYINITLFWAFMTICS